MVWQELLRKNVDITSLSNFKTPATAKYYFEIKTRQDIDKLNDIYDFWFEQNLEVLFIWWWTNLLFAFEQYNWIIVNNCLNWWNYNKNSKILETYSNEEISEIAKGLEQDNWQKLWHRFIWLPWTVWWAVVWNAWCFGLEASSNFLEAEVYNYKTGQSYVLWKEDMDFEYRSSKVKKERNLFVIKVKFDLTRKEEKYSSDIDNIDFRENKQPKGNTCWSFFKNPSKEQSAWKLIEEAWFKWYKLWWALFSPVHANFLLNTWWTYQDLIKLISLVQNKIKKEKWIDLVPEVRIIFNK